MALDFVYSQPVKIYFGEVGKLPYLRKAVGLTKENILATAKKAVSLK